MKILLKNIIYILFKYGKAIYHSVKYENYKKLYSLPQDFRFNGEGIVFYGDGEIIIGNRSYIGSYSTVNASAPATVTIGNNCSISHNVRFYTSNKNPIDIINNNKNIENLYDSIIIGDNCWIGANVFIKEGVSIGDNVVIGANSMVTKSFPSNCIIGGVPAKVIKKHD